MKVVRIDLQGACEPMEFESKKALILDDTCVGCTLCAFACPVEAITMESKV